MQLMCSSRDVPLHSHGIEMAFWRLRVAASANPILWCTELVYELR